MIIMLLMLFSTIFTSFTQVSSQQSSLVTVSTVIIEVYYYVDAGFGTITKTVVLTGNVTYISIPLLKPLGMGNLTILSCVNESGENLSYILSSDLDEIVVAASGAKSVTVNYIGYNYFDELAPGVYGGVIDLSPYANASYVELKLYVPKEYNISVAPHVGVSYGSSGDYAVVRLTKPLTYIILLTLLPLPSTGGEEGVKPSRVAEQPQRELLVVVAVALGISAVALTALYFLRRRPPRIEVEALPPSILEDETSKIIIRLLGEAGEKGVKQSDLVRLTGRPKSSISRRVKRLAEEGYVEIIRAGKHNIVKLSDKGVQVYRSMRRGAG